MRFKCNICEAENEPVVEWLPRDEPSCTGCGSTVRLRALMRVFSEHVFGLAMTLPEFPVLKSIRGLGISDDLKCAELLAEKFDYRNTYYHLEPHFDITEPPADERGLYDFVLAADVFEHPAPPVEKAFAGAFALLKPEGFLAMTVPFSLEETSREHFPELHEFGMAAVNGQPVLINHTRSGEWQVFDNLMFHGGRGSTLEMRLFSAADLRRRLAAAGFGSVEFSGGAYEPFGVSDCGPCSVPMVASNQPYRLSRRAIVELLRQSAAARQLTPHYNKMAAELEESNHWAMDLDAELQSARQELVRIQSEEMKLRAWAQQLDREWKEHQAVFEERTRWALHLDSERERHEGQIEALEAEVQALRRQLDAVRKSRWLHLGGVFGLGPKLD